MTITCPRCGDDFETQAITATRCCSCRSVVHVGRGTGQRSSAAHRATTAWSMEPVEDGNGGIGLLLVLVAVGVGVGIYLYVRARRRAAERRKSAEAKTAATGAKPATEQPQE